MLALRRNIASADRFPEDVLELQGYLTGRDQGPRRERHPRQGHATCRCTSSARRCSGPPSPQPSGFPMRSRPISPPMPCSRPWPRTGSEFRPSAQLDQPYVIAGVNVIAADTKSAAEEQLLAAKRAPGRSRCSAGAGASPTRRRTSSSPHQRAGTSSRWSTYSAVGTPSRGQRVRRGLRRPRRRRRAHGRPPVADDGGPAALGGAARRRGPARCSHMNCQAGSG